MSTCDDTRAVDFRARLQAVSVPLPGSLPYDNTRRLFVQARYDGLALLDFFCAKHPHRGRAYWRRALDQERVTYLGRPADGGEVVAAGAEVAHVEPNTREPDVDTSLELIYEDEALWALDKPAPLPVHPSGRFNKNTVTHLLALAFPDETLRPVHRLDANTTGLLVLARTKDAARDLARQFEQRAVDKRYLVEVRGQPARERFTIDTSLTTEAGAAGGREAAAAGSGTSARTVFTVLRTNDDASTALLEAHPESGRTNQIRLHLREAGLPIVGDEAYGERPLGEHDALTTMRPIHLHAWRLALTSPARNTELALEAPPPSWARDYGS